MSNDIEPTNDKGERHGYWEVYFYGNLLFKRLYHNDKQVGYEEWFSYTGNGELFEKRYHI